MSIATHYFLSASFCWMLAEGIHIYNKIVRVFSNKKYSKVFYVLGWGKKCLIHIYASSLERHGGGWEHRRRRVGKCPGGGNRGVGRGIPKRGGREAREKGTNSTTMHNILQPKKLCDGGKPGLRGTGSVKVKPPDIPSPLPACVAGGC